MEYSPTDAVLIASTIALVASIITCIAVTLMVIVYELMRNNNNSTLGRNV